MYELHYSAAAQKYFKKVKEEGLRKAFEDGLISIAENPYSGLAKVVVLAGTRENFYQELKRYMK